MADDAHTEMMNQALTMFALTNPLHPDVFPAVRKFEAEIAAMTASLVNGGKPEVCAAVTRYSRNNYNYNNNNNSGSLVPWRN